MILRCETKCILIKYDVCKLNNIISTEVGRKQLFMFLALHSSFYTLVDTDRLLLLCLYNCKSFMFKFHRSNIGAVQYPIFEISSTDYNNLT